MKCLRLKLHSNWLGATALAGTLGIGIFSLTAIQPVTAQSIFLSGGGGGGGSLTGNGGYGAGGFITSTKPEVPNYGGSGTDGGKGGLGGSGSISGKNNLTSEEADALGVTVTPPTDGEGDSHNTGKGGLGGNITAKLAKDITVESIILEAGNGGEPGKTIDGESRTLGIGGNGGDATLTGADRKITINDTISLTSGHAGGSGDQKSNGGKVGFTTGKIIVGADKVAKINLERNDGQLLFRTDEFDATKGDATINLTNTEAWGNNNNYGVTLGDLKIGMGRQVTINGNGDYNISSLIIGTPVNEATIGDESNNTIIAPAKFSTEKDLKLDSSSKLIFYLPENVNNGSSLLRITGKGNIAINDASVELRLAGTDLRNLQPGDQVRLIEGQVIGNSHNSDASVSNGAKTWNFGIATSQDRNLIAALKGPTPPSNTGDETGKGSNSGINDQSGSNSDSGKNNNSGDNNTNGNNSGKGNDTDKHTDSGSHDNSSNNQNTNSDNNNQNNAKGNNGTQPNLIGKDDGKGNIYTDNYGAVTINRAKANAYFQSNAAALNALNYGADQIASIDLSVHGSVPT